MAPPVPGFDLNENGIPSFEALPLRKTAPQYAAWGLYGDKDELGTLNRLTDERVAAAAQSEIKTGHRISLNLPLNAQSEKSFFQRQVFRQQLIRKDPRVVNDDVWTFNSQVSTQWDGLRHFAYQREGLFYNGVTQDDVHGVDADGKRSTVNGIHAWAEKGIVGRGILIDYHSWRLSQPADKLAPYDSFESLSIPLSDLQACLAAQGTEIKFGDILFIRSGFTASQASKPASFISAHQELKPPHAPQHALHEVLLAGWGCPIGELFDLERLAAHCGARGRWSFFVASEPCNVPGGVASPPNVLAIF
ncbi:hypothetical protein M426DRAFT_228107 [Hypoxylon sp. CI-4A]|nr:hypothetical protein M426DRAFT_228107 [Hypoxylon sp. CI-4A]